MKGEFANRFLWNCVLYWFTLLDSPITSRLLTTQNSYWFLIFYVLFISMKIWTPNRSNCPYFFCVLIRRREFTCLQPNLLHEYHMDGHRFSADRNNLIKHSSLRFKVCNIIDTKNKIFCSNRKLDRQCLRFTTFSERFSVGWCFIII